MNVSIFLITDAYGGVGGAEKRIFGLWMNLQKREINCRLATHQKLLDKLVETGEFSDFEKYRQNILIIRQPQGNLVEKSRILRRFIKENLGADEVLHFVMYYPLLLRAPNPIVFTDPYSNTEYGWRHKAVNFARILLADKADILDPSRGLQMQKKLFWKPEKIRITSNTFVDLEKYKALKWSEKRDWLVFLGRFEPVKQIVEYARSIPAIHQAMREETGLENCKFFVFGHGSLESELQSVFARPEFAEIDVEMRYEPQPNEILAQSKIFFSLQKFTNFPSKSLAEAIACGCLPIVTDNGATRRMAQPQFSFYVPENFTAEILAAKVREIYELSNAEKQEKSNAAREFAAAELSIEKMTDYYLDLYKQAQSRNIAN